MSDQHLTDDLDDEELTFEIVKPLGGIISVRFNGDEMLRLRGEVQRRNTTVSGLIKEATLTHIAYANQSRHPAPTVQSPDGDSLTAVWWRSNHALLSGHQSPNTCAMKVDQKSLLGGEPPTQGLMGRRVGTGASS